jgi:RluA family pseudouridine synthase
MVTAYNISNLYEDGDFLAVNKPPSLLVIPDRFNKFAPNLLDILRKQHGEIFVVHRLDKETSGIVICGKNADAHRALSQQFEHHKIRKTYLALVQGNLSDDSGMIDLPIAEHRSEANMMVVDKQKGKPSVTEYRVLERFSQFTFIQVHPLTGRTHQIRIHLKAIGHPLAIDSFYGKQTEIFLSDIKPKFKHKESGEKPLMSRLTLHASHLEFIHFRTQRPVDLEAPLPKDFSVLLKYLRKFLSAN